nr:extensin family protein [Actibacterium sp. MT2.3-13A]
MAAPDSSPRPSPRPETGTAFVPRPVAVPVFYRAAVRPRPRPGGVAVAAPVALAPAAPEPVPAPALRPAAVPVYYAAQIRPRPRPLRAVRPGQVIEVSSASAVGRSIRPESRPEEWGEARLIRIAAGVRTQPSAITGTGKAGQICGDGAIRGEVLPPIPAKVAGCGLDRPVRVSSVDGVVLTRPATMDCETAKALKTWVRDGVKPAIGRLGGGVGSLRVVASYSCRTRNSQPGAKISEHGRGRAVDVAAVNLKNGVSVTVLKGWRDPVQKQLLKKMHRAACGPFGTVLGPNSDQYHKDHLHLDTARYGNGPYCR